MEKHSIPQYGKLTLKKTGAKIALTVIHFLHNNRPIYYIGTWDPDTEYRQIESQESFIHYNNAVYALEYDKWTQANDD